MTDDQRLSLEDFIAAARTHAAARVAQLEAFATLTAAQDRYAEADQALMRAADERKAAQEDFLSEILDGPAKG